VPKYSINDLNIAPRDATYWDKQGILPQVKGPGMRRKYDIIQSVWIKLIQQMRSLGIGLNSIKILKENLLEPKLDLNKFDQEALLHVFNQLKSKYDESLSPENLLLEMKENGPSIFKSTVLATIIFRKSFQCIVNKEGDYILYDLQRYHEIITKDEFAEFISEPHFSISISEAYRSLINEWSPKPYLKMNSLLSENEINILEYIRRDDVNSINIRFKDGEPYLLEIDEINTVSIEQRFLDVIARNGFQKITINTRNGKIVNYENKILKKLSSSTR
jgi:DNA-binding transcriptional MerR regulator